MKFTNRERESDREKGRTGVVEENRTESSASRSPNGPRWAAYGNVTLRYRSGWDWHRASSKQRNFRNSSDMYPGHLHLIGCSVRRLQVVCMYKYLHSNVLNQYLHSQILRQACCQTVELKGRWSLVQVDKYSSVQVSLRDRTEHSSQIALGTQSRVQVQLATCTTKQVRHHEDPWENPL